MATCPCFTPGWASKWKSRSGPSQCIHHQSHFGQTFFFVSVWRIDHLGETLSGETWLKLGLHWLWWTSECQAGECQLECFIWTYPCPKRQVPKGKRRWWQTIFGEVERLKCAKCIKMPKARCCCLGFLDVPVGTNYFSLSFQDFKQLFLVPSIPRNSFDSCTEAFKSHGTQEVTFWRLKIPFWRSWIRHSIYASFKDTEFDKMKLVNQPGVVTLWLSPQFASALHSARSRSSALQHEELGEGVDFNAFLLWEKQGEFGGFVCSFVGFAPFPPHFCWFT